MIRGISGGQKRRVTSGEMIVGPKRVVFMDGAHHARSRKFVIGALQTVASWPARHSGSRATDDMGGRLHFAEVVSMLRACF